MTGEFTICRLTEPIKIEGADNIVKYELYGETIVTQNNTKAGDLGILFDCETQLSAEFCRINDLFDDESLNVTFGRKGYISSKNRRVRPITLKGVKVSAMWMPIKSLRYCFEGIEAYEKFCRYGEGTQFKSVGDIQICNKYITPETQRSSTGGSPNGLKSKVKIKDRCPNFHKHFDTQHWGKVKPKFDYPFKAIITEKLHGTSLRVGLHPVKQEKSWWQKLMFWRSYPEKYSIVVGTRNTIKTYDLDNCHDNGNLYIRAARYILSYVTLAKDETLYCEIVGYDGFKSIMPSHSNTKLKNYLSKEEYAKFIKDYGDTTTYSYDKHQGDFDVFTYRRTIKDTEVPYYYIEKKVIKYRDEFVIKNEDDLVNFNFWVKELTDGPSAIGKHIKEGICIRLEKGTEIQVFKSKSFIFKVLEGIAKESDTYKDIEEVS